MHFFYCMKLLFLKHFSRIGSYIILSHSSFCQALLFRFLRCESDTGMSLFQAAKGTYWVLFVFFLMFLSLTWFKWEVIYPHLRETNRTLTILINFLLSGWIINRHLHKHWPFKSWLLITYLLIPTWVVLYLSLHSGNKIYTYREKILMLFCWL